MNGEYDNSLMIPNQQTTIADANDWKNGGGCDGIHHLNGMKKVKDEWKEKMSPCDCKETYGHPPLGRSRTETPEWIKNHRDNCWLCKQFVFCPHCGKAIKQLNRHLKYCKKYNKGETNGNND